MLKAVIGFSLRYSSLVLNAAALVVAFVVVQFFATPTHQKAPAAVDA